MLIQNITSFEDFQNYIENYKYVFVNIGASWCKPCNVIKPLIEKFVSVIEESEYVYLKIDNSIYEEDTNFDKIYNLKKIPYFAFMKNGKIEDYFVNADFDFVSQKMMNFIKNERINDKKLYSSLEKDDNF